MYVIKSFFLSIVAEAILSGIIGPDMESFQKGMASCKGCTHIAFFPFQEESKNVQKLLKRETTLFHLTI